MKFLAIAVFILMTTSMSLSSCAMQAADIKVDNFNQNNSIACTQRPELCQPAKQPISSPPKKADDEAITITEQIKDAQRILKLLRHENKQPYYNGKLSGEYDDQTKDALIDFQKNYAIKPAGGQLDEETIKRLKTAENDMNLSAQQPIPSISSQTIKTIKQTLPSMRYENVNALSNNDLYELTAYLKELGYYSGKIANAPENKAEIEKELMNFQKNFDKSTPTIITNETWDRLKRIELNDRTQSELDATKGAKQVVHNTVISIPKTKLTQNTNTTQPVKIVKNHQQTTNPVSQPKNSSSPTISKKPPQPASPTLPIFQLTTKQNVFAVEEVKCKNKNAAWITFYEGEVQNIQNNQVDIQLFDRYALWYDSRKQGFFYGDWWCIPRQRFCYAKVKFSDWGGTLETGANYTIDKNKLIPTNTPLGRDQGIAALSAELADAQCGFKKKR